MAAGQFGLPILAYFGPFLTNFSAKSAIFLVRAGSGHPKSGPGRVGPLKTHGPRAKFWVGLWPDPALQKIVISFCKETNPSTFITQVKEMLQDGNAERR